MNFNKQISIVLLIVVALGFGLGCPKKEPVPPTTPPSEQPHNWIVEPGEPAWVTRSGAGFDNAKDAFYGMGLVQNISNLALLQQTADARARAELARVLDTYVANFTKDYMSSAFGMDLKKPEEEQVVSSITKSLTEATLVGSQIVDRWKSKDGKTMCSLAEVSFDNLAKLMRAEMRKQADKMKVNADEALKELDEQLEKNKPAE